MGEAVKEADDKLKLAAATQLAADTLRHAATAEWWAEREFMRAARGNVDITVDLAHEKLGTVTSRAFTTAVQQLMDITSHAPRARDRTRAAEVLVKLHISEMELKMRYLEAYNAVDASGNVVVAAKQEHPDVLPRVELTQEQVTELLQLRRKQGRV